jgi:hypothetical protein
MITAGAGGKPSAYSLECEVWATHAETLAAWAWQRLVVRRDCWGAYTPPAHRGQLYTRRDGTTETVPQSYTAKGQLTLARLARHFRGCRPEDLIGLHSTSTSNTCLAARVDIDAHGPGGNEPAANLKAALAWYDRLAALQFRPLLYSSNAPPGEGGYHLGALFAEAVPAVRVFAFLRWLTDDHAVHGLAVRPELFPKQPAIAEGGFGNWLRIVGRHHTREFWPSVWDGSRWLTDADAVAHVLSVSGDAPGLIPTQASERPEPKVRVTVRFLTVTHGKSASLERRIDAYIGHLPNLGLGQGRDDVAYGFACWLKHDLGLTDEKALTWLERWDQKNRPPKGKVALERILGNASKYGGRNRAAKGGAS